MRAGTGRVMVWGSLRRRPSARRPMPASSSSLSVLAPVIGCGASPPVPLSAMESIRLVQALKAVPDPRRRRGRRHGLQSVLLLAVQAVMAGAGSWVAIAQWAATAPQALGVCGAPPSASTFRRVLAAVDITAVEAALTRWVIGRQARCRQRGPGGTTAAEARTVLAVDGKTLRGSRDGNGQQTRLVSVYDHAHQSVLTQAPVAGGDELAAFNVALAALPDLGGVPITADALHCQRAHADFLAERGGHYLFTVTGNQPLLRAALRRLPWAHALFPHARRAVKVIRRRRVGTAKPSVEVVYAVTSRDHRAADARLLARWLRGHWAIENRVHHVRDVTQREDASRIRLGSGPQMMAALRNTATNIARLGGQQNMAAAQRTAAWSPTASIAALKTA